MKVFTRASTWLLTRFADNFGTSLELLRKAEVLTEPRGVLGDNTQRLQLRATTFSNLGAFYKRHVHLL